VLSDRDAAAPTLDEVRAAGLLPAWEETQAFIHDLSDTQQGGRNSRWREAREAIRREVKRQLVALSLNRHLASTSIRNRLEQLHNRDKTRLACGVFEARQQFRDIFAFYRCQSHDLFNRFGYPGFIRQPTYGEDRVTRSAGTCPPSPARRSF